MVYAAEGAPPTNDGRMAQDVSTMTNGRKHTGETLDFWCRWREGQRDLISYLPDFTVSKSKEKKNLERRKAGGLPQAWDRQVLELATTFRIPENICEERQRKYSYVLWCFHFLSLNGHPFSIASYIFFRVLFEGYVLSPSITFSRSSITRSPQKTRLLFSVLGPLSLARHRGGVLDYAEGPMYGFG